MEMMKKFKTWRKDLFKIKKERKEEIKKQSKLVRREIEKIRKDFRERGDKERR